MIHLFLVVAVQIGILLSVGNPYIFAIGTAALTAGALGGLAADGRYKEPFRWMRLLLSNFRKPSLTLLKKRRLTAVHYQALLLRPIVLLASGHLLARIDTLIGDKPTDAERRRWMMHAILEELSRQEYGSKFPFKV